MRRTDREITDINEIFGILNRCDTINIAMNGGDYPYVIPMTFGCALEDGKIAVYIHCAGSGRKMDILGADPKVCVESALYYRVEETGKSITARYESVIGIGDAVQITDPKEKLAAMRIILDHYNKSGFPAGSCEGMLRVVMFRIELKEVSGKHNLPQ